MKRPSLLAAGILAASLVSAHPALAQVQYVSATSGPVTVAMLPVQACNGNICQSTPSLWTVGLRVGVLAGDGAVLPTITPWPCPLGIGTALMVNGGSTGGIVTAVVFGARLDGSAYEQSVGMPVSVGPYGTVVVRACL